jgi:hypothetical protein
MGHGEGSGAAKGSSSAGVGAAGAPGVGAPGVGSVGGYAPGSMPHMLTHTGWSGVPLGTMVLVGSSAVPAINPIRKQYQYVFDPRMVCLSADLMYDGL